MFALPRFLRYPAFPAVGFMLAGVGAMADGYSTPSLRLPSPIDRNSLTFSRTNRPRPRRPLLSTRLRADAGNGAVTHAE